MDEKGFRQYLVQRKELPELIEEQVALVREFEGFLGEYEPPLKLAEATGAETQEFVDWLIEHERNSYHNLLALARYGWHIRNFKLYVAILELLDGEEAMQGLRDALAKRIGAKRRDEVLAGLEAPPLGTSSARKAEMMRAAVERMELVLGVPQCKSILSGCLRNLSDEYFLDYRRRFEEVGNIDRFLAQEREEFIAELTQIMDDGGLYFSQPVSAEVIEYVRANPELHQGLRRDGKLIISKIPYQAKEYLAESDPRMKRYYYCHCPWARESIRTGQEVPATFCNCSAGFHKKPWEVALGAPLQAEVLESVLKGDMRCLFAIELPPHVIPRD
jgi:hypothetical protein